MQLENVLLVGVSMKRTMQLMNSNPLSGASKQEPLQDHFILHGVPRRSHCPVRSSPGRREEWAAVLNRLRVPFLLLGVVGALGLLAHYRPEWARLLPGMYRPNWWVSIFFLALAGSVTAVLTADWIAVRIQKRMRRSRVDRAGEFAWRGR
jgi:hypothetical protein